MRALLIRLLTCVVAVVAFSRQAGASDTWVTDARGRTMRVVFDPARRIHLGAAHAPQVDPQRGEGDARTMAIDAGLTWQHVLDAEDDTVRWNIEHRLLHADAAFGAASPTVSGEVYALRFLRWSQDGSISLPTSPPRRLPFPFGVGFELGVGRPELRTEAGPHGEIGVARGALLLDLVPRREPDGHLTLGIGPRYDLRLDARTSTTRIDHLIVPFSQPQLAFHRHTKDGHHAIDAAARAGYVWSNNQGAGAQATARIGYEAIVLALNDAPMSLTAQVQWRYDDPPRPGTSPHEVIARYGVRFGLPLD
jgi:hypothetical protein